MRISLYSFEFWCLSIAVLWVTNVVRLAVKGAPLLELIVAIETTPFLYYLQWITVLMVAYTLIERFLGWAVHRLTESQCALRRHKLADATYEMIVILAFLPTANTTPFVYYLVPLALRYILVTLHCGVQNLPYFHTTIAQHQRLLFAQLLVLALILAILAGLVVRPTPLGETFIWSRLFPRAFAAASNLARHVASLAPEVGEATLSHVSLVGDMIVGGMLVASDMSFPFTVLRVVGWREAVQILMFQAWPLYNYATQSARQVVKYGNWRRIELLLSRYGQTPTAGDLERHGICIICRGEMVAKGALKLVCGHCVHRDCLEQWTLSQERCPTCRINLREWYEAVDWRASEAPNGTVDGIL
jgi:hypothetical protein